MDWPAFHQMRIVLQEHNAHWQAQVPELTKPQYAVMRAIEAEPGLEQSAAASAAATDKATLAVLLLRLESRGLIGRAVDPQDRRRKLLRLTPGGRELLRRARPVVDGMSAELLARLTEPEQAQLTRLLAKLATG
ncbi:MarR family winged helix-turn-helix transcriptional regulator [Fodinicola feengrottensis]